MKIRGVLAVLIFTSLLNAQNDSLIISEIMFYPLTGNNEFIELYNISSQSIDLHNYAIRYYTSLPDTIISSGSGTILSPESYAVILEGDYDFVNGIYKDIIPDSSLMLKISNNAFGSNGMANTTSRPVSLHSSDGNLINSYFYSADNTQAISDEKKMLVPDTLSLFWSNSLRHNGTPGFRNSVLLYTYDLSIFSISILPEHPVSGENIELRIHVKNKGIENAGPYTIKIYNDINFDSIPSPSELLYSEIQNLLQPGDSSIIYYSINNISAGNYNFIAEAEYPGDEFPSDNILCKSLKVTELYEPGSVIINEIMYAPQNGEPEWIEIFNNSDENVNIKNWGIGDAVSAYYITRTDYIIAPDDYIILTRDSSIQSYYPFNYNFIKASLPSFNNTGDAVILLDSFGLTRDSLYYSPGWGGLENRSLERKLFTSPSVNKDNWASSINMYRATPGFINSVTPKTNDASVKLGTAKNFAITGEQIEFELNVKNNGKDIIEVFNVSVYNDINSDSLISTSEEIKTFSCGGILPGDSVNIKFLYSGFTEGYNYFIAKIIYEDEDSCNNFSYHKFRGVKVNYNRNDIIITEVMYAPEGEPEWIEFYNRSSENINLKNFMIADASDTVRLTNKDYILIPSAYLIISNDSILLQQRNILSDFIKSAMPAFNNSGDRVILIDSLVRVIDSLNYSPFWGGKNGYSIERISLSGDSADSLNWGTSINKYRATPGYINSLSQRDYDSSIDEIFTTPQYPVKGDTLKLFIKVKNRGIYNTENILNLYKVTGYDSLHGVLLSASSFNLQALDSSVIQPGCQINNISQTENLFAEILTEDDCDTSDNYLYKSVIPGYLSGSILINEIMYSPQDGEPEWVEFYNNSHDTIPVKNWNVKDILLTPGITAINTETSINPGEYFIISSDSSIFSSHRIIPGRVIISNIPNLNNDADGIVLTDNRGIVIDSMVYKGTPDKHRSLERISVKQSSSLITNWRHSEDYELSTPGRINSIAEKEIDIAAGNITIKPVFPCFSDTVNIAVSVRNFGKRMCDGYIVNFLKNDSVLSVITGNPVSEGDSAEVWCAEKVIADDSFMITVRIVNSGDEDSINNISEKIFYPGEKSGSILINEIMYDPSDDDCEWVEFYNPSSYPQNLKNWSVSDILPSPGKNFITGDDFIINPGEYTIAAHDSLTAGKYHLNDKFVIVHFGSLSSSGDGIILYDYRDGIIDSVKYDSKWGGKNGRSLERKTAEKASNDSSNWTTSLSINNATPGKINSVTGLPSNSQNSIVINEIMYEPDFDNCEFIEFYNRSGNDINIGGWCIERDGKDFFIITDTTYILSKDKYLLFAADSSVYEKYSLSSGENIFTKSVSSFGFLNNGGIILLKDINGCVIDSLSYTPDFHNRNFLVTKNRSLERISYEIMISDKSNWSSCTAPQGATPCRENSIQTGIINAESGVIISPNPFSPDNDGWEDFAVISYNLKTEAPVLRIKIFDNTGRLVRTLSDNIPSGSKGQIIFDGRDDSGRVLRIGIYILYLEAVGSKDVEIYKSAFVIARKL